MIKTENGNITMQGSPASLLVEVSRIIKTLKRELEEQGVPEEVAARMLSDAYMFAVVKPEQVAKLMLMHTPGEEIKWDEILN